MRQILMETGGRRFTGQDVDYMMADIKELTSALADFAANEYPDEVPVIITGVRFTDTGSTITATDGWIHWNGELYQFISPGPIAQTGLVNVKLFRTFSEDAVLAYKDTSEVKPIQKKFYISMAATSTVDADVDPEDRITVADLRRARMHCEGDVKKFYPRPGKALIDYYNPGTGLGQNGQEGWAICDGRNGTPDLRGRFCVGFAEEGYVLDNVITLNEYMNVGSIGGERLHKLSLGEIAKHKHKITGTKVKKAGSTTEILAVNNNDDTAFGDQEIANKISEEGGDQPHENRPPYIVMAYFQRIADI